MKIQSDPPQAMTAQSSELSANDERVLKQLIDDTLARRPNHKKDDAQLAYYFDDLADLVRERGITRVVVRLAWTTNLYLPEPAEVRECMPEPDVSKQFHDPNCPNCRGTEPR